MREWNLLVKKTYKEGKAKNSSYSLGDAMKDAREFYHKGVNAAKGVVKGVNAAKGAVKDAVRGVTAKRRRRSGTKTNRRNNRRSGRR